MQTTFSYTKPKPISYRNCPFDSRAEFKYALSIEDDHRFLREYVTIWYDPRTNLPVKNYPVTYLPEGCRKYTPDFLVRNVSTGNATLVEVKPSAFSDDCHLQKKTVMAETFIRQQNLDWEFKIVYDDEIELTKEKWQVFQAVVDRQRGLEMLREMQRQDKQYNSQPVMYFNKIPALRKDEVLSIEEYVRFVRSGTSTLKEIGTDEQHAA